MVRTICHMPHDDLKICLFLPPRNGILNFLPLDLVGPGPKSKFLRYRGRFYTLQQPQPLTLFASQTKLQIKTNNASDELMIEIAVTKLKDIEMESPLMYPSNSPLQKWDGSQRKTVNYHKLRNVVALITDIPCRI